MLKKLKNKFILLYTVTTGVILTVVLFIVFWWNHTQQNTQQMENFSAKMEQVQYLFQKSAMFNATEFAQFEKDNEFILAFKENGNWLSYIGYTNPETSRTILLEEVIETANEEKIFADVYPSMATKVKSSVTSISGENGEKFLGQVIIIPNTNGWKTIIGLQKIATKESVLLQYLPYFIINVMAIVGILIFSIYFVQIIMEPVEEGQRKQIEFVAAASHELRSPLAVIKACASATQCCEDQEKKESFLKDVELECDRMSKLIDEMLLLASAEAKSWSMKLELFDLDNFLIERYEMFLLLLESKKQELVLQLPENMQGKVRGNQERLYQVLGILLENAAAYSKNDTKVELVLSNAKRKYQIQVVDHGVGITEEDKRHIFERFYRADKSRNDKAHYGLGLSIAYELIERMGGKLSVEDTPGGGTTFTITLPIM